MITLESIDKLLCSASQSGEVPSSPDTEMDELFSIAAEPWDLMDVFCRARVETPCDEDGNDCADKEGWRAVLLHLGYTWQLDDRVKWLTQTGEEYLAGLYANGSLAFEHASTALAKNDGRVRRDDTYERVKNLWLTKLDYPIVIYNYEDRIRGKTEQVIGESTNKGYEQVGGDFGDPWLYGGTWYEAESTNLVHFEGTESDPDGEFESSDKAVDDKLETADYRAIMALVTLEDTDSWECKEDEIREDKAAYLNAAKKFPVYRTFIADDEDFKPDFLPSVLDGTGMDEEEYDKLPNYAKVEMLASHMGWLEYDSYPYD